MQVERWLTVKQLFEGALVLSPHDREAFLVEGCKNDLLLRREVESLIESYVHAGAFLEGSPTPPFGGASAGLAGRRVGPYEIGDCIGAGGMGEVYRARDTRLTRTVAIKVCADRLRGRLDLREQLAREATAISALNHPHICLLHDVGRADDLDFLVMEYVDGEPIDAYCDRHELSIAQRIALFCTVCDAVHYAHQNLVVHRDLKPANILVTGDGRPKLLDFGIAKLLAANGIGKTVTAVSPALTPDYASPEQVRGEPITTATDIYSLGVVLYELLAGCRPFVVRSDSLEDIVHAICETDASPPSATVHRSAPSGVRTRIARELRGDLDTIVLKALRKEPDRRYRSAQALSDDLSRYLTGQPVDARGEAVAYRVSKFVGRHQMAAVVTTLFVVGLIAAMALIVRQSRIAEGQRQRAERRFADVRRLAGSFLFEFHDAIKPLPGSTRARELVTRRALEYLDSLAQESADDPTLRAELARAYHRVADVQGGFREANLGHVSAALASYRKALALQEGLVSADPINRSVQRDLAETLIGVGDVQLMLRDTPAARESFRRALAIRETLTAGAPADRDARRNLAVAYHRLGDVEKELDRAAAVGIIERAVAILEPLAADERDVESRHALARSYKVLGVLRAGFGDYEGNLVMTQRALRLNEALLAADPLNVSVQNEVAVSGFEVGLAYERLKNLAEALESFRRAERMSASMAKADPSNVQARWMQALELNLIGANLCSTGRPTLGAAAHREALALLQDISRADSLNENYHYNVANTYQLIGEAYVVMAHGHARAGNERRHAWMNARSWFARSAADFDGMRRRGTLTGAFVPDADAVNASLALCARELGETTPEATVR